MREDYSSLGDSWEHFPHDHAPSRTYRWGEDGLLGICDRECRICFALVLWNGRDPILKERLFGLANPQGNHGEDVKEAYFYLDSTPTHSFMRALYKYPQAEFPYGRLLDENRKRGLHDREFEIEETGVFDGDRYFDVFAEYAKASPNDVLIRVRAVNRGPERATLHLLPTLWFRNTWAWGRTGEGYWPKPALRRDGGRHIVADHSKLGRFRLHLEPRSPGVWPPLLFTENETNVARLYGKQVRKTFAKDGIQDYVLRGQKDAVNPAGTGTKAAAHHVLDLAPGEEAVVRLRLTAENEIKGPSFGEEFERTFEEREREADEFFESRIDSALGAEEKRIARQAYAGLLWNKQFYHYVVKDWVEGDPSQPQPPEERHRGRNTDWVHLSNRDVLSMPDKWEYPYYAAWDLAFHMLPFARVDPRFSKEQLVLLLREWFMHPSGQIPAYEFSFSDVNPPVHAWATWRVFKIGASGTERDRVFLSRVFQKLLINFTWWVNRKDPQGRHIFAGGFLGLDNIGLFDRSRPLPAGGCLDQADGTAWMAFYCATMLSMALELSKDNPATEDIASKFFEHFISICDAMNSLGGAGLWDEEDGFYYDKLLANGQVIPLRIRSMVGIIPLFAVEVLEQELLERLGGFKKRMDWFLENRQDLASHISYLDRGGDNLRLLAIPSRGRLERVLHYILDENEFLSPYGIRSLSKFHEKNPYVLRFEGGEYRVEYESGESHSRLFGGNSNWRGPVWFPVNYLLIEALERYYRFYGDTLLVECPTGSGNLMNLLQVAQEISRRLARLFLPDAEGGRPCHGGDPRFRADPHWKDLLLFHEYFDGDTGRGIGAKHQTGWTALVIRCLEDLATARRAKSP